MVKTSKSFSPWAPLGGLKIEQASIRCMVIRVTPHRQGCPGPVVSIAPIV